MSVVLSSVVAVAVIVVAVVAVVAVVLRYDEYRVLNRLSEKIF